MTDISEMNEINFTTRESSSEKDVIACYDDYAASWDQRFGESCSTKHFLERRLMSFLTILGDGWHQSKAVELGVGTGAYIEQLSKLFSHIIAVDGSTGMLRELKKKLQAQGTKNVSALQANVLFMPEIADSSVDVVYFFGLLEHIIRRREFVLEIKRILRKDGIVIGVTPNGSSPWYFLRSYVRGTGRHCTTDSYYTKSQIMKLFIGEGFIDLRCQYWGAVPAGVKSVSYKVLRFVEHLLEGTRLSVLLGGLTFRLRKA
jgi:ubiquinone/menaquinone biosynthesis C-methylase UbiE